MRKNLDEWESSLKPFFEHIKLLGEIPITHIELEQLSNLIRDHIKRNGKTRGTHILETDYRRTFAVFLAMIAAHNTDREYWRIVSEAAGITLQRMSGLDWGEIFLGILKEFELPTFGEVGGYRFVTPIRLHGGIPAYSLPDFFAYVLWPSVKRDAYKGLTTDKFVPILLQRSAIQAYVDSPVLNFLENGGEYAIEFLDHCRKMARSYNQTQEIPDPDEIDLPPYVVRSFQQWTDEELETEKGKRLRSPRLYLDPWGPTFYLFLPPESVEGLLATRSYYWQVEMQGKDRIYEQIERVRVRRRGYDLETTEVELPLENPTQRIVVSYCCQDAFIEGKGIPSTHILRRWRIDLLPMDMKLPLMVFCPDDGRALRWNQTLPAQELWLIFPGDMELKFEGESRSLEFFPQLISQSGRWNIQSWDLGKAYSVQLVKDGKGLRAPIPVLSAPPDPILVGSILLESDVDPDSVPFYIGSPPWIRIPIRSGRSVENELENWVLNIESRWAASPELHNEVFKLSDLSVRQSQDLNSVDVALSPILADRPCGTYRIVTIGPYDIRTEIQFRIWPEITIEGLKPYYLPDPEGAQKVLFSLKLPEGCEVLPQAGVEGVSVSSKQQEYQVIVDPEKVIADLHLIMDLKDEEPVRMPLALAIPRLRWSMLLGQETSEINWIATPIKSTVDALLQAEQSTLFLDFPLIDELPLIFKIHLVDPEDGILIQEHSKPQRVRFRQTRWRFPLGEFSDTIRSLDEQPVFDLQLEIQDTQNDDFLKMPVIRLRRELDIQDVRIDFLNEKDFRICWSESKPLRNRRVEIWSEWQPWLTPTEVRIPDEVRGELLVEGLQLPPSYYRLHFFTAASWEEKDISPVPPKESHLVKSVKPPEMLSWIDQRMAALPDHILLHFFKACVLEADGKSKERDSEIEWCYQNLDKMPPKTILAFHNWLGGYQLEMDKPRDLETQRAVRISMFRPQNLKRLFQSHGKGDQVFDDYLEIYTITPMIMPESALMLIDNDNDPARVMHSLQILVKRQSLEALARIIDLIEKGQLSEHDAGELIALNQDFTIPSLLNLPENAIKLRLINRIVKRLPDQDYIVLPVFWIRTTAGWGRIEKIINETTGMELPYYNQKEDKPRLNVTLRPDQHPERIKIDLAQKCIDFLDAKNIYICTKDNCNLFASVEIKYLRNEHNSASHDGIGPAFRFTTSPISISKPEIYSINPPEDQFE